MAGGGNVTQGGGAFGGGIFGGGSAPRFQQSNEYIPSGFRPAPGGPQFQQPIYQPQYMNYGMGNPMSVSQYGQGFGRPSAQFDRRAIQANPQGFEQFLQGASQQKQFMPGSTFLGSYGGGYGYSPFQMQSPFAYGGYGQQQMGGYGQQAPAYDGGIASLFNQFQQFMNSRGQQPSAATPSAAPAASAAPTPATPSGSVAFTAGPVTSATTPSATPATPSPAPAAPAAPTPATTAPSQMQQDYFSFFDTAKPGTFTDFAGGTLYRPPPDASARDASGNAPTTDDRAIFYSPSGQQYTLRRGSSLSDIAYTVPEIAQQWKQQYGFSPTGTPPASGVMSNTNWNPIRANYADAFRPENVEQDAQARIQAQLSARAAQRAAATASGAPNMMTLSQGDGVTGQYKLASGGIASLVRK